MTHKSDLILALIVFPIFIKTFSLRSVFDEVHNYCCRITVNTVTRIKRPDFMEQRGSNTYDKVNKLNNPFQLFFQKQVLGRVIDDPIEVKETLQAIIRSVQSHGKAGANGAHDNDEPGWMEVLWPRYLLRLLLFFCVTHGTISHVRLLNAQQLVYDTKFFVDIGTVRCDANAHSKPLARPRVMPARPPACTSTPYRFGSAAAVWYGTLMPRAVPLHATSASYTPCALGRVLIAVPSSFVCYDPVLCFWLQMYAMYHFVSYDSDMFMYTTGVVSCIFSYVRYNFLFLAESRDLCCTISGVRRYPRTKCLVVGRHTSILLCFGKIDAVILDDTHISSRTSAA